MKYIVLTLVLSYGCVSVSFSNTSLDSLYRQAYYTDSVKSVVAMIPDFKNQCSGDDLEYLCKLYFLIGHKAWNQQQLTLAFSYYHQSFDVAQQIDNYSRQRSAVVNIALLYFSINDFTNAKKYKQRAITYAREAGQTEKIGSYLYDLSVYSRRQGQIDSAIYYAERSYEVGRDAGNLEHQAVVLNELGLCAYEIEDYDQAIDYYYRALNLNDTSNYIKYMVFTNHGLIEVKRNNLPKAKSLHHKSILASKALGKTERELIPQFNLMGEIYMKSQEYDSALAVFAKALFLNDYKGLKGANTEELHVTVTALHQLDSILDDKYLLTDLGVYGKYSEFILWLTANQNKLQTLNAKIALQMQEDRIIHQQQTEASEKQILWLTAGLILCSLSVWGIMYLLRLRKRKLILQKMDAFDDHFEEEFDKVFTNIG